MLPRILPRVGIMSLGALGRLFPISALPITLPMRALRSIRVVGILSVKRNSRGSAVVETGRLLRGVIPEPARDEALPVCDGDVEIVGLRLGA